MPDSKSHPGICYLVGAGPGDLGLVTLKARACVEKADVLVYDYLCNPVMLAWAPAGCEIIYAGKKAGNHAIKQGDINALLVERARAGKIVVRLKGGDPYVFGRGAEEAQDLVKAGIAFEVVPGISSVIAGPAYAGIPVTHREFVSQLTVFTGHEDPGKTASSVNFDAIAKAEGTKVMLMGVERIDSITQKLIASGMKPDTPVAMIRWATTGRQQTIRGQLDSIARIVTETGFEAPAVVVFGDVVNLRDELNWFEKRPLFGRRIVVTRTRAQAGELSTRLAALGADVIELPTIRIEPPIDVRAFAELVVDVHTYDWLVFTSPNGVNAFFEVFYRAYTDAREVGGVKIAAIGPATASRVKEFRLLPDLQPKEFVTESLIEAFKEEGALDNQKVLIVRAEKTRDLLAGALAKQGAIVDEAVGYRTVPETIATDRTGAIERLRQDGADMITFASSSAVENFAALNLALPAGAKMASMGPVTSRTLRRLGFSVDIEAPKTTIESFANAIAQHYSS
jgi:uroporphyrinogen III methyltransferase/synthase